MIKKSVFVLLFIISLGCQAQNSAEILQKKLNAVQSYKANFSQVVKAGGRIIQRSKGNMAILRPGKFRWYSYSPMKQLIVADGEKLWIFDKELEQVTVKKQNKGLGGTPALFLSGYDDTVSRDFEVNLIESKNQQIFKLIPYDKEGSFKQVTLIYQRDKLTGIILLDKLDQTTRVKFSRIIINPSLKNHLFEFKPPKGVDVIKS